MAVLILIRHADARWSQDEMRPLSSQGRKASCDLGRDLERLSISRIVSSPYLRAIQTVEPLATITGLRIEIDNDLRERKLAEDPVPDFEQAVRKTWDDFDFRHPGGETSRTAQRRIVDAIARHLTEQPGDTTAVSTHGNVLALYLNSLDRSLGFAFWRQLSMPDAYYLELGSTGPTTLHRLERGVPVLYRSTRPYCGIGGNAPIPPEEKAIAARHP